MKLSDYAKKKGISYDTAWRMWNRGQLQGERLPTGTIIIFEDDRSCGENKVAIYARVSSSENKWFFRTYHVKSTSKMPI